MGVDDSLRDAPLLQVTNGHGAKDPNEEHPMQLRQPNCSEARDAHDGRRARRDQPKREKQEEHDKVKQGHMKKT